MEETTNKNFSSDNILRENLIFAGLDDRDLNKAKDFFSMYQKDYKKDEIIKKPGEYMQSFGIVIRGNVIAYMDDIDGNHMIVTNVFPSEAFGEALCFLEVREVPIYIKAFTDCLIAWLSPEKIKSPSSEISGSLYTSLTTRYISMLSDRMLAMNDRIQVLSKNSLRRKLTTFFSQCEHRYGQNTFDISMSRYDLAVYLGVDRSALSRELSAMKNEGIIEFYKNSFRLLNK